jgi:RNase P subunit RPR2
MRLVGLCRKCNKFTHVTANNAGMVQLVRREIVVGLCSNCEDAERQAARARHPSRRGRVA